MKTILFSLLILSVSFISCTTSTSTGTSTSTKTTTRTINSGTLRYNETITDEQATALSDYLVKEKFFDGNPITVQVGKVNDIIHFAMELNDKDAYSEEYQTLGKVMIDELEQKVFKGSTVELDWCDENFNVKKNIKRSAVTATNKSDATTADENKLFNKSWFCENITGGVPGDTAKAAKELEILKNNFSFNFEEEGSFGSRFINQNDVRNPIEIQGSYTLNGNTLSLHHLTVSGQSTDQQMNFTIKLQDDEMQLISQQVGQPDLVMTFTAEYE